MLREWQDERIRNGSWYFGLSQTVSNLHVALKPERGKARDDPSARHKVRVCMDASRVNQGFKRIATVMKDVPNEINRVAGNSIYWYTDIASQFETVLLAEESSKYLAVYAPDGIMLPRRVLWGYVNAGSVAQRWLAEILHKELPEEAKRWTSPIYDDMTGFAKE